MKKLILIDNERIALEEMKKQVEHDAEINGIQIITLHIETKEPVEAVANEIEELIPKNVQEQGVMELHIVIDTCLTDEEHSSERIDENFSGIQCLFVLSNLLSKTECKYKLSLMSRFFAKQLDPLEKLNNFKDDANNHFYAIIRKPFLESGQVDNGFSTMPQYVSILPEERLSKSYLKSFRNILIFPFFGGQYEIQI